VRFPLMRDNITRSDLDEVIALLKEDNPRLTNGPRVQDFERAWSDWLGVKYSTFVSSGSAANFMTLQALKIRFPEGGEVIVPPLTWLSDISSCLINGFKPVFVDIEMPTLSMSTEQILSAISNRTRAVFITHAQGFNGLTDKLLEELDRRGIILIEDVCESHGARHGEDLLGTLGWCSNFSFFFAHHMSTIEGGMISTNDHELYQITRMLRSHGMVRESTDKHIKDKYQTAHPDLNPDFIFFAPCLNFRNTEIGATIGLSQLKRLDTNNQKRTKNFKLMNKCLRSDLYFTDFKMEGSSNYAFQIILKEPSLELAEKLMELMRNHEIEFRRGSAGGGNQLRQPYLKEFIGENDWMRYPVTEHIHFFGFYIGNYPELTASSIEEIASILNSVDK